MSSFEFLGPYRIGQSLGRGGMGAVYSAVHEKTGERVAVKLIAQHVADEPRFRRRFDAEVKTLQRLRHPGIVRLIGFGEESGHLFYSMELVEGESLQKRIAREKRIDWRATIDIAIQICAALKHAHDFGVIHRDLKPANLLLTADDTVKLVDFGIAKIFGDGEQTMAGAVLGTADYMAPEQADSVGITPRTDLYALGSVMYAMLTGRPPFTGKRTTDVINSLKRDRPVPLDLVDPDLPDALSELIHELLEKDPQQRPPTALAVMNRLKAMRAGLQRDQTVLLSDAPTESFSPEADPGSDANTSGDDISAAATGVVGPRGTDSQRPRTIVSKAPTAKGASGVGSSDPTIVSGLGQTRTPDHSELDADSPDAAAQKTHFQTVDASRDSDGFLPAHGSTSDANWLHAIMLVATIGVLIGCVVWFIVSIRPPTADEAYANIIAARDQQAMDDFLERFPDDPRHQEVRDLSMEAQLTSTLKRLRAQSRLGVTPLDAAAQGFLDAMETQNHDPAQTRELLGLWLNVHGDQSAPTDPAVLELIELARFQQRRLETQPATAILDPRAKQLLQRINDGIDKSSPEATRKMLEGILRLHRNDDWARPALQEAQTQLDALVEFADSPEPNSPPPSGE